MPRAAPSDFVAHALDLMRAWARVDARAMFGGWGLYRDGRMLALVADEVLYLKVDAQTAARFAAAGSAPFVYSGKSRTITMSYWRAPEECLETPAAMHAWCELAWSAVLRAPAPRKKASAQRRRSARTKS